MSPCVVILFVLGFYFVSGNNFHNDHKFHEKNSHYRNEGFIDKLKSNGIKIAQEFLGSESIATKVAEFVVKAFQTTNTKSFQTSTKKPYQINDLYTNDKIDADKFSNDNSPYTHGYGAQNPFSAMKHIVKLIGLQPSQISAVAINALLFVAQMISSFFSGPKLPPRPYRSEDMISWIIDKKSSTLQQLILEAKNKSLVQTIDNILKQQGNDQETSCIRLLVCKISPFVTKMQEVVFGGSRVNDKSGFRNMIQRYLPNGDEIKQKDHTCELEFRDCDLNEV